MLFEWIPYYLDTFSKYQLGLVDRPFVICHPNLIKISLICTIAINAAEQK